MNSVAPLPIKEQEERSAVKSGIPGRRLELVFNPVQHGTATPWLGLRFDGGRGGEPVTPRFRDPLDVADELLDLAQRTGETVVMPAWLRDSMIARWQQRGIELYRQEVGREWCTNAYVRQGWDAAYAREWQPALFGWPELAA